MSGPTRTALAQTDVRAGRFGVGLIQMTVLRLVNFEVEKWVKEPAAGCKQALSRSEHNVRPKVLGASSLMSDNQTYQSLHILLILVSTQQVFSGEVICVWGGGSLHYSVLNAAVFNSQCERAIFLFWTLWVRSFIFLVSF